MQVSRTSRRSLIKSAAVLSVAGAMIGVDGVTSASVSAPRAFRIDHDPSIRVSITPGKNFQLTVYDLDGDVVEEFLSLTVDQLLAQPSTAFTVTEVRVPVAA